jgi:uncharacterized protein
VIFVDSNIPMYLVGAPHPHKADAQRLLEGCVARGEKLVTSVEVFQEILHRYTAIERRAAIQPAFDALLGIVDEVFPIDLVDVERAKTTTLERHEVSARDSLHAAVMTRHGISTILSFDTGFDRLPGLKRLS